jgi:hypothetical protein
MTRNLLGIGISAILGLACGAAAAQDFTAGKSPAQVFNSDCTACHRSAAGLAKGRDARALASFLKEHYTTKPEYASAVASYVATFTGAAPPAEPKRGKHDAELGTGEEPHPRAVEELPPPSRRNRTVNLSGDGEKPRVRAGAPEPARPQSVQTESVREDTRLSRVDASAPARREAADPLEQVRGYVTSGLNVEATAAAATKIRPAKPRHPKEDAAQPRSEPAAEAKAPAEPAGPPAAKPTDGSAAPAARPDQSAPAATSVPEPPPAASPTGAAGPRADAQPAATAPIAPRLGH